MITNLRTNVQYATLLHVPAGPNSYTLSTTFLLTSLKTSSSDANQLTQRSDSVVLLTFTHSKHHTTSCLVQPASRSRTTARQFAIYNLQLLRSTIVHGNQPHRTAYSITLCLPDIVYHYYSDLGRYCCSVHATSPLSR